MIMSEQINPPRAHSEPTYCNFWTLPRHRALKSQMICTKSSIKDGCSQISTSKCHTVVGLRHTTKFNSQDGITCLNLWITGISIPTALGFILLLFILKYMGITWVQSFTQWDTTTQWDTWLFILNQLLDALGLHSVTLK